MKVLKKENKFVSLVVYLHNAENEIGNFLKTVLPVFEDNFMQFEIICVDDGCTDGTVERLKEYLDKNQASVMVNIVHMSFFHGLEGAMNAGRDLAIGDFIYEFDHVFVDYPIEILLRVYQKVLEGNDIVAAGSNSRVRLSSRIFYCF